MKYSEAKPGRIFVLRLEDGDTLPHTIESFARRNQIEAAALIVLGGADTGSKLVAGPESGHGLPVIPMEQVLEGVHDVAGVGTIFPNSTGQPSLHMHIAGGRDRETITGCVQKGVRVWRVMELVLWELTHATGRRLPDPATGFELLQP